MAVLRWITSKKSGGSQIKAFELKFGNATLGRSAEAFKNIYSVDVQLVNQDNYLEFILPN